MRNRNVRRPQARSVSTAEFNPLTWRYIIVMIVCGFVLASGFFFAARQHFASMEFGIKNSTLRKQLEDLESENRRLLLSKEVALSPGEIKKVARNLGFRELGTESVVATSTNSKPQIFAPLLIAAKPPTTDLKPANITRTAYQRPSRESPPERAASPESVAKQSAKPLPSGEGRERVVINAVAKLR
ncbi:MAG: hypothetical protein H7070_12390 [Saprospiraceae bacterium]|nr:hypothetical protein [Pyrinomonadaceae bacterium]